MNAIKSNPLLRKAALVIAAVATLGSMPAWADSPTVAPQFFEQAVSTKSRAEVRAEVIQARRDGTMPVWSDSYLPPQKFESSRTRAEVRAEVERARRAGTMPVWSDGFDPLQTALLFQARGNSAATQHLAQAQHAGR